MAPVAHWDEVEEHRVEGAVVAGRSQDLRVRIDESLGSWDGEPAS